MNKHSKVINFQFPPIFYKLSLLGGLTTWLEQVVTIFLVTDVEWCLLELCTFGFGLDLGTGLGADFRNLDFGSLVLTRKVWPRILQSKIHISRSNINTITRNCMSLFSCKDVTMRFLDSALLLDTIHLIYDPKT